MTQGSGRHNRVIHGLWSVVLLGCMPAFAFAQVRVSVVDATTKEGVPYAHVYWHAVGNDAMQMSVSGPDGESSLSVEAGTQALGIVVRTSSVGYVTQVDTLLGAGPFVIQLAQAEIGLDEFVVTGQYSPRTADHAVQRMRVIDATKIQRMAANDLGSALRNEVNMQLGQDNVLGSSVSMQGLSGENVKVLIDGVPVVGRQNGNVDLSQIDLTGIERIEVVEGPLSVNYGTNALAGTINLITKKGGTPGSTYSAKVYAEHIGRLNTTFGTTWHRGNSDVVLSAGRNYFAGWDPDQEGVPYLGTPVADTTRYQQWKPREQYFGRLNYRWSDRKWSARYKGEAMHDLITDRGMPRAPYYETAFDQEFLTVRLDNAVFVERQLAKGKRASVQAAYDIYRRTRSTWFRDLTDMGGELVESPGMQDTTWFTLANVRAVFASARDTSVLDYELGTDVNVETGRGERIGTGEQVIGDYALFGSLEYRPVQGLTIRPGARVAYNTQYQAPVVPSLNVRWRAGDQFTWRAAYAKGFRAPSLKELYFYFVDVNHDIVGNPDLIAERSDHIDLGVNYRHARGQSVYKAEASMFANDVTDMITLAQVSGNTYSYVNVGNVRTMGGNVGAGWDNGHWIFSTNVAVTGREDDLPGSELAFTPELRASLTKEWRRHGYSLSVFYKYQGTQVGYVEISDTEVARNEISAFHMADANVSKRIWGDRFTAAIGCKDIFDVQNVNASLSGGAHSGGGTSVPMSTGRTFFLRIDMNLKHAGE